MNLLRIIFILIIYEIEISCYNEINAICEFEIKNYTRQIILFKNDEPQIETYLTQNFNNFSQLNFKNCSKTFVLVFWKFIPNNKLIINNQLRLEESS